MVSPRRIAATVLALGLLMGPREALAWGGELGREPDRFKGSGLSHDRDLDSGHYLNPGDTGLVADALSLDPLPPTRADYDTVLWATGSSQYQAGYPPQAVSEVEVSRGNPFTRMGGLA